MPIYDPSHPFRTGRCSSNTAREGAVGRGITCISSGLLLPDRTHKRDIVPPGMEGMEPCAFPGKTWDGEATRGRHRKTASGPTALALEHVLVSMCNASGLFQAVAALCRTHMSSQCAPAGIRVTTISEYVCIVRETAIVVAEINDA